MEAKPQAMMFQDDDDPRFVQRARIAFMEYDPALRLVTIRSLLRQGCVVRFKRDFAQLIADLQAGSVHGAVVDLAADLSHLPELQAANHRQVPIVVLTDAAVDPYMANSFATICVLQKPFDMRELLSALHLSRRSSAE